MLPQTSYTLTSWRCTSSGILPVCPCLIAESSSLSVCDSLPVAAVDDVMSRALELDTAAEAEESRVGESVYGTNDACMGCCECSSGGPKRDLRTRGGLVAMSELCFDCVDVSSADCVCSDMCSGRCLSAALVRISVADVDCSSLRRGTSESNRDARCLRDDAPEVLLSPAVTCSCESSASLSSISTDSMSESC